ncbi:MAG: ABC transporter permease, partial [Steroidobacteraceae bacterium]
RAPGPAQSVRNRPARPAVVRIFMKMSGWAWARADSRLWWTGIQSRLASLDVSLEEAAMDLGARPWKVFMVITLPIIFPAILAGWLLAFTLSWDDLVITSFVSGPGSSTLPIVIFSKVRLGVSPDINALATIMVGIVAIGVVATGLYLQHQERRRERDVQAALANHG